MDQWGEGDKSRVARFRWPL